MEKMEHFIQIYTNPCLWPSLMRKQGLEDDFCFFGEGLLLTAEEFWILIGQKLLIHFL